MQYLYGQIINASTGDILEQTLVATFDRDVEAFEYIKESKLANAGKLPAKQFKDRSVLSGYDGFWLDEVKHNPRIL